MLTQNEICVWYDRRPRVGTKARRAGHILRKWTEFCLILMQWQRSDGHRRIKSLAQFFRRPFSKILVLIKSGQQQPQRRWIRNIIIISWVYGVGLQWRTSTNKKWISFVAVKKPLCILIVRIDEKGESGMLEMGELFIIFVLIFLFTNFEAIL